MHLKKTLLVLLAIFYFSNTNAQFAYGDHWYQNPLGFQPVNLHTSMGFFIPAVATGVCLLLSHKDSSLQNRMSIYNESGFSWGYKYPFTSLSQNNTGVNYQLRKWLSAGSEFCLYFPRDAYNSTFGIAVRPFFRFYPVNRKTWQLYFESGGGFVYLADNFPKPTPQDDRLGTHLNGTTKYGLGAQVHLSHNTNLVFGARHLHVSNGNTKGVERNPSHDSNGLFLGFAIYP